MLGELKCLCIEFVFEKELNSVKSFIFGSFVWSMECLEMVVCFVFNIVWYKLLKDYYVIYFEQVEAVILQCLQEVVQKYLLLDQAYIVVVGNVGEVVEFLECVVFVMMYDKQGCLFDKVGLIVLEGLIVMDVIENYIEVFGGCEKLESVKDMSMIMGVIIQGMVLIMKLK